MSKILKLAFAMGGGVSLGTFSSAALVHALQVAVIIKSGESAYSEVKLDVMSGASAGSLTMALILLELSKAIALEPTSTTYQQLKNSIEKRFSDRFKLPQERDLLSWQELVQLERLRIKVERLWEQQIDLAGLLATEANGRKLSRQAALFNRGTLEQIALDLLNEFDQRGALNPANIIADNLLVSMSLTALAPMYLDARRYSHERIHDANLSKTHRDMRTFQIQLRGELPEYLMSGYVCGIAEKSTDDPLSANQRSFWQCLLNTAIASGAFPGAFEAVPLVRYKYEYPDVLQSDTALPMVPVSMLDWADNGEASDGAIRGRAVCVKPEAVVPYIDGGVLNNEPLREAFRLAEQQDRLSRLQGEADFERLVILIDPNVSNAHIEQQQLAQLSHYVAMKPVATAQRLISRRAMRLDKMLSSLPEFINVVVNEATVNEQHRSVDVAQRLKNSVASSQRLFDTLIAAATVSSNWLLNTVNETLAELNAQRRPAAKLSLVTECQRIALTIQSSLALSPEAGESVQQWLKMAQPAFPGVLNGEAQHALLARIYVDSLCQGLGKDIAARLLAISPVDDAGMPLKLPGRYLSSFAGFLSPSNNSFEYRAGQFAAEDGLKRVGLLPISHSVFELGHFEQQAVYTTEVHQGIQTLASHFPQFIHESALYSESNWLIKQALKWFGRVGRSKIKRMSLSRLRAKEVSDRVNFVIASKTPISIYFGLAYPLKSHFDESAQCEQACFDLTLNKALGRWCALEQQDAISYIEIVLNKQRRRIELPNILQIESALQWKINPIVYLEYTNSNSEEAEWKVIDYAVSMQRYFASRS